MTNVITCRFDGDGVVVSIVMGTLHRSKLDSDAAAALLQEYEYLVTK